MVYVLTSPVTRRLAKKITHPHTWADGIRRGRVRSGRVDAWIVRSRRRRPGYGSRCHLGRGGGGVVAGAIASHVVVYKAQHAGTAVVKIYYVVMNTDKTGRLTFNLGSTMTAFFQNQSAQRLKKWHYSATLLLLYSTLHVPRSHAPVEPGDEMVLVSPRHRRDTPVAPNILTCSNIDFWSCHRDNARQRPEASLIPWDSSSGR